MEHLQRRLEVLEQRTHTIARQLRWWQGLACALMLLSLLSWAQPLSMAQETAQGGERGLARRVAAVEQTLRYVTRATDEEGRPEVRITGANLRIVNGLGRTDCGSQEEAIPDCPNGLGNLIVGYNELRDFGENIRTGSHNVVVGRQHNFSRFGGLVVGEWNEISGEFASVSAGSFNTASGPSATVSGGRNNTANGWVASVSGGYVNTASGEFTSVNGGRLNTASGAYASVSGGHVNTASGSAAAVSGGRDNMASGASAAVSAGLFNTASGDYASVSGGRNRTAPGDFDWVAGPFFADE